MKPRYYVQIDILKAIAIISVLIMHASGKFLMNSLKLSTLVSSTPSNPLITTSIIHFNQITFINILESLKVLTIWQAVPVFFVLIGITWGMSFKRRNIISFKDIYLVDYFKSRIKRLYFPYIILFIISVICGYLILNLIGNISINFSLMNLVGNFPFSDRPMLGSYFVTLILEMIFIFPIIYISYIKFPRLTIILILLIDFFYQCFAFYIDSTYYSIFFIRILSAIVIGIWISNQDFKLDNSLDLKYRIKNFLKNYKIFIMISLIGMLYLFSWYLLYRGYISSLFYPIPYINSKLDFVGSQNFISFIYTGFLIVLGLIIFPNSNNNKLLNTISLIGKASYHIFLIQILYFALFPYTNFSLINNYFLIIFMDIIICLVLGIGFYKFEKILSNLLI